MNITLTVIQIVLSIILAILIFIQSNDEADSRSNIMSSVSFQKRGWEKVVFYFTMIVLGLFIISSIIQSAVNV